MWIKTDAQNIKKKLAKPMGQYSVSKPVDKMQFTVRFLFRVLHKLIFTTVFIYN